MKDIDYSKLIDQELAQEESIQEKPVKKSKSSTKPQTHVHNEKNGQSEKTERSHRVEWIDEPSSEHLDRGLYTVGQEISYKTWGFIIWDMLTMGMVKVSDNPLARPVMKGTVQKINSYSMDVLLELDGRDVLTRVQFDQVVKK